MDQGFESCENPTGEKVEGIFLVKLAVLLAVSLATWVATIAILSIISKLLL